MASTDRGYDAVVSATEPLNDEDHFSPLEVRVEEREKRRRHRYGRGDPPTRHRFYVVRHSDETVVFEGRWTTGDRHNPYAAARARAWGFASGYATRDPNM